MHLQEIIHRDPGYPSHSGNVLQNHIQCRKQDLNMDTVYSLSSGCDLM